MKTILGRDKDGNLTSSQVGDLNLGYAYPSSPHSYKMGFEDKGCYFVERCDYVGHWVPISAGYITQREAEEILNTYTVTQ